MRWIYLSPHLDDAVLSAGGWIYDQSQAGDSVEIWTLMSGAPSSKKLSPFAAYLHEQWGMSSASEVIRGRRLEDDHAAKILGAKTRHFNFLDCIYRKGHSGDWLYFNVFTDPSPDEADLPAQIAEAISARLKPDDKLVCQLGIGEHVDHVTVRHAAELLNRPLHYVADIPYLFNYPGHLKTKKARLKANVQRGSRAGLRLWKEAIMAYESQVHMLFKNERDLRRQINQYWSQYEGICFWVR